MIARRPSISFAMLPLTGTFLFVGACARTDDAGPGPTPAVVTDVYVAGQTRNTAGVDVPCLWKNGVRTDLSVVDVGERGYTTGVFVVGNDVYVVGGTVRPSTKRQVACVWRNGVRTDYSGLDPTTHSSGAGIFVSGSDVFVAGSVQSTSWIPYPCLWKNGELATLSVIDSFKGGVAAGVAVSGGHSYVVGTLYHGSGQFQFMPSYWVDAGPRTDMMDPAASIGGNYGVSIAVAGSDVYAAGWFSPTYGVVRPCCWRNSARIDLSVANPSDAIGQAHSVFVSRGDVYVAGYTKGASTYVPCFWKNEARTDLVPIDPTRVSTARSVFVVDSDVFVAGTELNASNVDLPCYWKNGARTGLSTIAAGRVGTATSIFVTRTSS